MLLKTSIQCGSVGMLMIGFSDTRLHASTKPQHGFWVDMLPENKDRLSQACSSTSREVSSTLHQT